MNTNTKFDSKLIECINFITTTMAKRKIVNLRVCSIWKLSVFFDFSSLIMSKTLVRF